MTVNTKFYTCKGFKSPLEGHIQYHVVILTTYREMGKEKNEITCLAKYPSFST